MNGKVEVDVCMITSRGGKGMVFPKVRQCLGSCMTSLATAILYSSCKPCVRSLSMHSAPLFKSSTVKALIVYIVQDVSTP